MAPGEPPREQDDAARAPASRARRGCSAVRESRAVRESAVRRNRTIRGRRIIPGCRTVRGRPTAWDSRSLRLRGAGRRCGDGQGRSTVHHCHSGRERRGGHGGRRELDSHRHGGGYGSARDRTPRGPPAPYSDLRRLRLRQDRPHPPAHRRVCAAGRLRLVLDPNNDLARLALPWPEPPAGWLDGDAERAATYLRDTRSWCGRRA